MHRPPRDSIKRFLASAYSNYGNKYIEFLFGAKVASLFHFSQKVPEVIELLSTALIGKCVFK